VKENGKGSEKGRRDKRCEEKGTLSTAITSFVFGDLMLITQLKPK
jgi:hypothetical protein